MFSHFYMQILKFLWCMRVCPYTLGERLSRATSRLRDIFIDYIMCFLKITKSAFNSSDSQKSHVIYEVSVMLVSEKYKDHYVTFGKSM